MCGFQDGMRDNAVKKRGAPMGEDKCPFLEMTTVTYCKAFPTKKMIPVDRATSAKGTCHTGNYRLCSAFREIDGHESAADSVRGFSLRPDYYYHPRHLWVSPGKENDAEALEFLTQEGCRALKRPLQKLGLPRVRKAIFGAAFENGLWQFRWVSDIERN